MVENDADLRDILIKVSTIAVVGIKDDPEADAYRIPRYAQEHGYRIRPVNPKVREVMDEPCVASLGDLDGPVDMVNLFRAPEHIPGHVDEILALDPRPRVVWMQLGIQHGEAAARLRAAGVRVVQDRCLMIEHRRLLGEDDEP